MTSETDEFTLSTVMARWLKRRTLFAALLALSCEGGQTGQPTSATCHTWAPAPDQPVNGMTPAEHADAYAGRYAMPLVWREGSSSEPGAMVAEDEIVIELGYEGGPVVARDCQAELWIEVVVGITIRDRSVQEMGTTDLVVRRDAPASLSFAGKQVAIHAVLNRTADELEVEGTLTAFSDALPSTWAEFNGTVSGAGGSGGTP